MVDKVSMAASRAHACKAVITACVAAVHEAVPLQGGLADMWPLAQEVLACQLLEAIDPGWIAGATAPAGSYAGAPGALQIANMTYASLDVVELAPSNFPFFQ